MWRTAKTASLAQDRFKLRVSQTQVCPSVGSSLPTGLLEADRMLMRSSKQEGFQSTLSWCQHLYKMFLPCSLPTKRSLCFLKRLTVVCSDPVRGFCFKTSLFTGACFHQLMSGHSCLCLFKCSPSEPHPVLGFKASPPHVVW